MEYHFLILLTFLSNFDAIRPVQVKTGESHFINPEKLWIESIMLRSVLHWNISTEHHLYSVYVKPKYHTAWTQVKNCTRVALTSCDVTRDLESPLVTYHVMLLVDDDDSYSLEFCPQHETSFLPPTYTSKLSKDTIFITPVLPINFGDGSPINKYLTTLIYEVKYWDPTESNTFKMKIASLHDSIITLQVNNGHKICLAMRLRMEFNPNRTSLWSQRSCFDNSATGPMKTSRTYHVMKWASVALSALFTVALLVFMAYKTIKMYRYVHKVGPIPEALRTVRDELESKHESTQNLAAEYENVVVLKLELTNLSQGNKSQLDTFSASENANELQESFLAFDQDPPHIRRKRIRSISKGYYSCSSASDGSESSNEDGIFSLSPQELQATRYVDQNQQISSHNAAHNNDKVFDWNTATPKEPDLFQENSATKPPNTFQTPFYTNNIIVHDHPLQSNYHREDYYLQMELANPRSQQQESNEYVNMILDNPRIIDAKLAYNNNPYLPYMANKAYSSDRTRSFPDILLNNTM